MISGLRPLITNMPACPRIAIVRYQRGKGFICWRGVELLHILRFRENRSKLAFAWRNREIDNDKFLGIEHWLFLLCDNPNRLIVNICTPRRFDSVRRFNVYRSSSVRFRTLAISVWVSIWRTYDRLHLSRQESTFSSSWFELITDGVLPRAHAPSINKTRQISDKCANASII
jgi:hypothetical protein